MVEVQFITQSVFEISQVEQDDEDFSLTYPDTD